MTTQAPSKKLTEAHVHYESLERTPDDEGRSVRMYDADDVDEAIEALKLELKSVQEQYTNYHDWAQEEIERLNRANAELLKRNVIASSAPEPPAVPVAWMSSTNPHLVTTIRYEGETANWVPLYRAAQPPETAPIDRYERGLATLYKFWPESVAQVCDEEIDHSGALLGRVRSLARSTSTKGEAP